MELDKAQLQQIASHIKNKTREFNIREGMGWGNDILPKRFFQEKLEDSGKRLPERKFKKMLSDYYELRGWQKA